MPTIVELVATITGKIDGFRKAMADGAQATEGFSKAWTKAGTDVATATARVGSAVGLMAGSVVAYTARMGLAFNSMKEDALTDFTVMLQSAEKAERMLADIQKFAAKTPFETGDITQAAKTLLNFGVAGDSIMPMLQRLGDASGGNAERFRLMALAYGQISSTGRLMGQDLLQLINAGFNPLQQISQRTGETMAELKKRMEGGGVSINEVNQAFVDATSQGGRFFGLMEAKSQTASGLMSTLSDNIKIASGRMFEPLFDAFKRVLQAITMGTDGAGFTRWVEQMRVEIGRVSVELMKLVGSNAGNAIRSVGDAFLWGARGTAELLKWLRQSAPEISRQVQQWTAWLVPIGQWAAKNPGIVAGIIALAVAFQSLQILGVVSAFTSLIAVIGPTIGLLAKIPALIMAIQTAAVAASGPMLLLFANPVGAGILIGLALIAAAFGQVAMEARAANAEADRLDKKFATAESKKRDKVLNYNGASDDETLSYLRTQRQLAEKNRVGLAGQAKAAAREGSGEDVRTQMELTRRAQEAEDFVAALDARIEQIGNRGGQKMAEQVEQQLGQRPMQNGIGGVPTKEEIAEQLRASKEEAKRQAAEDKQALKDDARQQANAEQAAHQQNALMEHTQTAAEQLDAHQFSNGSRAGVSDEVLGKANKQFDAIEAAGLQVANAFKNGQISATQYAQEMQKLKKATDEVTDAAIKEEQQKRKEALLKGDFKGAGLDFNASVQQKLEDKLLEQKMSMFDNAVDNVVNQFFPLATVVETVSDGFTALDTGLSKAGETISGMGNGGSSGANDTQAQQTWISYLQSAQGQIDSMLNNIAFFQQALTVVTDPTRIQQLTDSIAALNRQIAAIENQVHTFTGHVSNDPIFRDPGITGGGGQTSITINQHIPNVYNFTQAEIDHLSNSVANSLSRQGYPTFSR